MDAWRPSFLAARELSSQRNVRLDPIALSATRVPPYSTGENALLICFVGEATAGCHMVLGWPQPSRIVDLSVEFRNLTNGRSKPCGDGIIGALVWFGLPASGAICCRQTGSDDSCEVAALEQLFLAMRCRLDLPRALLRGRYLIAAARIETTGVPVDVAKLEALKRHWRNIISRQAR